MAAEHLRTRLPVEILNSNPEPVVIPAGLRLATLCSAEERSDDAVVLRNSMLEEVPREVDTPEEVLDNLHSSEDEGPVSSLN